MKFAVIGLAYTHPYSYTKILTRLGHNISYVWDDVQDRLDQFVKEYGAKTVAAPGDIPVGEIDGIIATGRIPERIDHAVSYLERGLPVYTSKPMATSFEQLERLVSVVKKTGTPYMSTSVLRYAPALHSLQRYVEEGKCGSVTYVRGVSSHFISHYMEEPGIWQDDPNGGGGTIINMGIHALEMLVTLFGYSLRSVYCKSAKTFHKQSLSEDTAVITLEWENGLIGVADIPCGVNSENFGVEVYGSEKILKMSIPKGDVQDAHGGSLGDVDALVEFGYVGTMQTFIEMCKTHTSPIPLEETIAIARVLLAARVSAETGTTIMMDKFPYQY